GWRELVNVLLRDLAQEAAADVAGAGPRQAGRELDGVGRSDRAVLLAPPGDHLPPQPFRGMLPRHEGHVRVYALALDVVRVADDGGLGNLRVSNEGGLDFGRPEPMAGYIDDVVDPAGDPVIAVGIASAAIPGEIFTRIRRKVRLHEAVVVAVDSAHLSGPGIGDAQISRGDALLHPAFSVDNLGLNAEEGPRCRAGLERGGARQRRDQD